MFHLQWVVPRDWIILINIIKLPSSFILFFGNSKYETIWTEVPSSWHQREECVLLPATGDAGEPDSSYGFPQSILEPLCIWFHANIHHQCEKSFYCVLSQPIKHESVWFILRARSYFYGLKKNVGLAQWASPAYLTTLVIHTLSGKKTNLQST